MVTVETVTKDNEEEYEEFVARCSGALAQHTLEWRDAICGFAEDEPLYLLARAGGRVVGVLPAFLYECSLGNLMLSLPFPPSYGGIAVETGSPHKEAVYAALLARLTEEGRRHNCLLVTICTPPFFGDVSLYRKHFRPDYELENFHQYLDLKADFTPGDGTVQPKNLRDNIKRNIERARKCGLRVSLADDDERFARWYEIHCQRMAEVGGQALPRPLFEGLRRHLLESRRGAFAYALDGEKIIGGALVVGLNQVIDYYMGSSDSAHAKSQPNSLLMSELMKLAHERGYRYWNWQSSHSRESPVYHYKAGWGSHEGNHYFLTKALGDISELKRTPLPVVREKYRWRYVLPYSEFEASRLPFASRGDDE